MLVPRCAVMLAPQCRRQLAAVLLRGKLQPYDVSSIFAHVIDSMIDDVLITAAGQLPDTSWELIAQRLIDRFAYRLPTNRAYAKAA